jgi:hypothetical protein
VRCEPRIVVRSADVGAEQFMGCGLEMLDAGQRRRIQDTA